MAIVFDTLVDKIMTLTKQLYPTGRAFRVNKGSWWYRLHEGLAQSEARAYNDALAILDSILPDNPNFTADNATEWERRLGMINGTGVDLEDRKLAIKRKMNHPGTMKPRENWMNLEYQLQAAGFNVWVHENRAFIDGEYRPIDPGVVLLNEDYGEHGEYEHGEFEHGDDFSYYYDLFIFAEHGEFEHGTMDHGGYIYKNKCVNFIDASKDVLFNEGETLVATVYIGGEVLGSIADVPAVRKDEFRQLILKLKETNICAYLLINYTT